MCQDVQTERSPLRPKQAAGCRPPRWPAARQSPAGRDMAIINRVIAGRRSGPQGEIGVHVLIDFEPVLPRRRIKARELHARSDTINVSGYANAQPHFPAAVAASGAASGRVAPAPRERAGFAGWLAEVRAHARQAETGIVEHVLPGFARSRRSARRTSAPDKGSCPAILRPKPACPRAGLVLLWNGSRCFDQSHS